MSKKLPAKIRRTRQLKKRPSQQRRSPVKEPALGDPNNDEAGCDDGLVLKRLSRIEENYAEIDVILSSLESKMPDVEIQIARQSLDNAEPTLNVSQESVDPRKPR